MLSLGLGLVALVAVSTVEGNLAREVGDEMPGEAPAFYFLDIQRDQLQPFLETVRNIPGVHDVQHMPQMRGRITAIKEVPVEKVKVSPEQSWVTQGDRGLTYAAIMPPGTKLAAGSWWPADYRGPPLISFNSKAAEGLGYWRRRFDHGQSAGPRHHREDRQSPRHRLVDARHQFHHRLCARRARRRAANSFSDDPCGSRG